MTITLYTNNDNVIVITGIADSSGGLVTGATLTGTIAPASGSTVATVTFGDVAGQPGNYKGSLLAADVPAVGNYVMVVTGTAGGMTVSAKATVKVAVRTF